MSKYNLKFRKLHLILSIHGLNTDDDGPGRHSHSGSEEDEDRQGFFVGGSTRSGQQVLGPNRRDLDSHLFNAIQRAGAERLNPEQVQALGQQQGGSSSSNRVTGGFRLGGHGIPSEIIGGSNTANNVVGNTANRPPQQVVRMYIWRNGFSLDDGPLRQFNDPSNQGFLQAVTSKRIPTELLTLYPGREVDLRVERKPTDYVAPKAKPFSGQGYRLGSLLPGDKKSEE